MRHHAGRLLPSSNEGGQRGHSSSWSSSSNSRAVYDVSSTCIDSLEKGGEGLHVVMADPQIDSDNGRSGSAAESPGAVNAARKGGTPQLPAQEGAAALELVRPKPACVGSAHNAGSDIVLHSGVSTSRNGQSGIPQRVWKGPPIRPPTHTDVKLQQHNRAAQSKPAAPAGDLKKQPTVIPHVAALGALVGALARASELDQALQLYKQASHKLLTCGLCA